MNLISAQSLEDRQYRRLTLARGLAFLLAVLAHLGVWQIYKNLPAPAPEPEPPVIEAALIVQPRTVQTPVAPLPAPQTQAQPPVKAQPLPKPAPRKLDKPLAKRPDKPKPLPTPEQPEEAEPTPTPVAETPMPESKTAQVETPKAVAKPPVAAAAVENTEYHPGHIGGFGRNNYPRIARERGWEGTVRLKVHVTADGDIGEIIVDSSSGHEMLDEAAIDMIKEGHATPARRGDKPIDSWVLVPYHFQLGHE